MTEENIQNISAPEQPALQPETKAVPVSEFRGTTLQLLGWRLLGILLSVVTLGIGAPWAHCMIYRWETNHTYVNGKQLHFDGKGHQLLGKYLLWGLLIVITLGIYAIFLPVRSQKWFLKHTSFATGKEEPQESGALIFAIVMVLLLCVLAVFVLIRNSAGNAPSQWQPGASQGNYPGILPGINPGGNQGGNDGNQGGNGGNQSGDQGNDHDGDNRPTVDPSAIEGTWHQVIRCDHPYDDDGIAYSFNAYYTYNSDGTFSSANESNIWEYDPQTGTATFLENGYHDNGGIIGTFTYDGSTLTHTITKDYNDYDRELPVTYVYSNVTVSGDRLYTEGDSQPSYERGTEAEIMARLYEDSAIGEAPEDTSIVGTWTYGRLQSDGTLLVQSSYTFAPDGTFTGNLDYSIYVYSSSSGWVLYDCMSNREAFSGVYQFDNASLTMTYTYSELGSVMGSVTYPAYTEDGVLYIKDLAHHQGSVNDIGNILSANAP